MIDKIRKIKYLRMKPEERFVYDIITNLVEYYHKEYPDNKYYKHNDVLLFDYNTKNGNFWCQYSKFWQVLVEKYDLNYNQTQSLVKFMVEEYLINDKTIPSYGFNEMEKIIADNKIKTINDIITNDNGIGNLIKKILRPFKKEKLVTPKMEESLIIKDVKPTCTGSNILPLVDNKSLTKKEANVTFSSEVYNGFDHHNTIKNQLIKKEDNTIYK